MLINWEAHGQFSPLTVRSLYAEQSTKGIHYLKYVSFALHEQGGEPSVYYKNPFDTGAATDLVSLGAASPPALVGTLTLHAFALVDQDYPFMFVTVARTVVPLAPVDRELPAALEHRGRVGDRLAPLVAPPAPGWPGAACSVWP